MSTTIHVKVGGNYINRAIADTRSASALDVVRDALTLYIWAIGERKKGRSIVSVPNLPPHADGFSTTRLSMASLDCIGPDVRATLRPPPERPWWAFWRRA